MKIPTGWKKVLFGNVVTKINNKVSNREEWTFDRYIGGQHFEEGEIRITRSAPIKGNEEVIGSAFHMKFKPGQVLYVTRNPRLRKGGMVDFEGVCSNVSFVLEADEKQLLQSLLPFIIQTEDFVKHTCNNAHGSTNPFLNWKDIAKYEFLLPPLEEQKKISEVLWSMEDNLKKLQIFHSSLSVFQSKLFKELFLKSNNMKKIKEVTDNIQYGLSIPLFDEGKYPNLKMDNLLNGKIDLRNIKYSNPSESEFEKFKLIKNDILFNRTNSIEHVGRTALFDLDGDYVFASYLVRLQVNKEVIDPYYLTQYLIRFNKELKQLATLGVHQANINATNLSNFYISVPSLSEQNKIIKIIKQIMTEKNNIETYETCQIKLRNKLSNDMLSGKLRLD